MREWEELVRICNFLDSPRTNSPLVQELINEYEIEPKTSRKKKNMYPNKTRNPLLKLQISDQSFCDLPGELIHIILCYYTHSFKDLIKFSTINKTCKQISDHSLLWLQVDLQFYPPRSYLTMCGYYSDVTGKIARSYLESRIKETNLPRLEKQLFSREAGFPPVFKVHVTTPFRQQHFFEQDLARYKISSDESDHETAYRVGKWWKGFFVQYQQLYHRRVEYRTYLKTSYLYRLINVVILKRNSKSILLRTVCIGIISICLLFDCNNTNLSLENKIGIYLLLWIIGFYMITKLIKMIDSIVKWMIGNDETLLFQLKYSYLDRFHLPILLWTSIFISIMLVLLKCDGSLGESLNWWETVLPLWIGFSVVYALWYYENRKHPDRSKVVIGQVLGAYLAFSPPLTCTLVASYYDNVYKGPLQYTLFPLYPVFLLPLIVLGYRVYSLKMIYFHVRHKYIGNPFHFYEWFNYVAYFSVFIMTNISIIINCWSVIMLLIDSYRIDDNDWDKKFFSVHFTPLTCFLIFLFSCPCIYLGMFVEDTYYQYYFELDLNCLENYFIYD